MNQKILLVDDNRLNRRIMSGLLKSMNFKVVEAVNGFEAVELIQTEDISLVLMDILMPEMDGYETTKTIRGLSGFESIPIIAVTADDFDSLTDKMKEVNFNDVITKPLKREDVQKIFSTYLSFDNQIFNQSEFNNIYDSVSFKKGIIEAFMQERESDLNRINESFKSRNFEEIYSAAHYMKGSFSYLKTPNALNITLEIMNLAKSENKMVFLKKNDFLEQYEIAFKKLKAYYKTL